MGREHLNKRTKATSPPTPAEGLATLQEAVRFLRFNEKTIRKKARSGELKGRMVFGAWRFPWTVLRELAGVDEPMPTGPQTAATLKRERAK